MPQNPGVLPPPHKDMPMKKVENILAIKSEVDQIPEEFRPYVHACVALLGDGQPPLTDVCDLMPGHPLGHPLQGPQVQCRFTHIPGTSWYRVEPLLFLSYDSPWHLIVESPTTAMEIIRRGWGPTKADIARELVRRGIAFRTVLESRLTSPQPETPGVALGVFPFGYKPTVRDYLHYEQRRDHLFQQPYGRAALMMGGIVWRLAIESLGMEEVLLGPSFTSGHHFQILLEDQSAVDDCLSSDDLDVICGVYKTLTSTLFSLCCMISFNTAPGDYTDSDTSNSSWWPRHEL